MKVKEMIERLKEFNPEAEIFVNAHCKHENFSFAFGGGDGVEKGNCETVSLYVDRLNGSDTANDQVSREKPKTGEKL